MTGFTAAQQHREWRTCGILRAASARSKILTLPLWALLTPSPHDLRAAGLGGHAVRYAAYQLEKRGQTGLMHMQLLLTQHLFAVAAMVV